jgi:GNAT superfamily N-acetyltransferase
MMELAAWHRELEGRCSTQLSYGREAGVLARAMNLCPFRSASEVIEVFYWSGETPVAANHPPFTVVTSGADIRTGSTSDIDLLAAIDLDASTLFERAGMHLAPPNEREVTMAERRRWLACLAAGTVLIAADRSGADVGFAALGTMDGDPFLDQLSVRVSFMRRQIGTGLLYAATKMAMERGGKVLWLTTYSHLSWNRPYYERHGFVLVSPEQCGEELRGELAFERRWLPGPEERVIMRKDLAARV